MKYVIKKEFDGDGAWFRAYDSLDRLVLDTVDRTAAGCEGTLRRIIKARELKPEIVKELEID